MSIVINRHVLELLQKKSPFFKALDPTITCLINLDDICLDVDVFWSIIDHTINNSVILLTIENIENIVKCANFFQIEWLINHCNKFITDKFIENHQNNNVELAKNMFYLSELDLNLNHLFYQACANGHLEMAQWLYSIKNIDIVVQYDGFLMSCENGHLQVARWLHTHEDFDIHVKHDFAFYQSCTNGHLEVAQWLHSLGNVDIHADHDSAFRGSFGYGHIQIVQWLHSLSFNDQHDFRWSCENGDLRWEFCWSCENGDLQMTQWLIGIDGTRSQREYAFYCSCEYGHLHVAQWLYSFGDIEFQYKVFHMSCNNGHLHVAQWLHRLNIHNNNGQLDYDEYDLAYRQSCENGHLEVVQWLYRFGFFTIRPLQNQVFCNSCKNGQLQVAQWLYRLGMIDRYYIHIAFRLSCERGHLQVAQWLHGICVINPYPYFEHALQDAFRMSCGYDQGQLHVAQWLYSFGCINTNEIDPNDLNYSENIRTWIGLL